MNIEGKKKIFKTVLIIAGAACTLFALATLDVAHLDLAAAALFSVAILFSSRITIPIPRFKARISPSDLFVFLALFIYGGQFAVILAASEAFFASRRFCKKKGDGFYERGEHGGFDDACIWVTYGLGPV
jgi:hypothetical protein